MSGREATDEMSKSHWERGAAFLQCAELMDLDRGEFSDAKKVRRLKIPAQILNSENPTRRDPGHPKGGRGARKRNGKGKVRKEFDTATIIRILDEREKETRDPKKLALIRSAREKAELFQRAEDGDVDALIYLSVQFLGQRDQ